MQMRSVLATNLNRIEIDTLCSDGRRLVALYGDVPAARSAQWTFDNASADEGGVPAERAGSSSCLGAGDEDYAQPQPGVV